MSWHIMFFTVYYIIQFHIIEQICASCHIVLRLVFSIRLSYFFLVQHVSYSIVQYSTVQYSTVQYSTVQYSTVQYSIVQYSTVQYSTVQYSAIHYSAVIHDWTARINVMRQWDGWTSSILRWEGEDRCLTVSPYLVSIRRRNESVVVFITSVTTHNSFNVTDEMIDMWWLSSMVWCSVLCHAILYFFSYDISFWNNQLFIMLYHAVPCNRTICDVVYPMHYVTLWN